MKPTDLRASAHKSWQAIIATLHNGLAAVGLAAVLFVALDVSRLNPTASLSHGALALGKVHEDLAAPLERVTDAQADPRHRALAGQLARKYRVAADATAELVTEAYAAATENGLDPLLILAVISIESRFNPIAQSDFGAKGLMQVVPRFHLDKLADHGGEDAVLDPRTNIRVGTRILKEYIQRMGSVEAGLQMYAGALEDTSTAYAQRVMTEKLWLQRTLLGAKANA